MNWGWLVWWMIGWGSATLWTGFLAPDGYGQLNMPGGGKANAHAVAWIEAHGPVPDGLELDHLCRVRHCVRLDHLEPVTHRENIIRGHAARAVDGS